MPVTQANSLTKSYDNLPLQKTDEPPKTGELLGGMKAEKGKGALPRAYATKTKWERFTSRVKQGWNNLTTSTNNDKGVTQRAERFNARHQVFSGKIKELVSQLVQGNNSDVSNPDILATLRNDVKAMHRDESWASRKDLLSTRLDVELGKLSNEELETVAKQLASADQSQLTSKDKADLQQMQRAVVRQQLARSPEMQTLMGKIDPQHPSDVSNRQDLLEDLASMKQNVTNQLRDLSVENHTQIQDILAGAFSISLRAMPNKNAVIGGMNRNLLNVEYAVRKDRSELSKNKPIEYVEIAKIHPELRMLTRAVREEFLFNMSDVFTDGNLRSRMKVIGSGAAHTVSKGSYEVGGHNIDQVHKYDDEELVHPEGGRFGAPRRLGIDQSNPRLLERAVFTSKLDHELNFKVCVGTNFASHHGQIGIVMDLASGHVASDTLVGFTENQAVSQRELTKLHLLDILTGQGDRHGQNYMVQTTKKNTTGVKAIDSDFCMGPEPHDINDLMGSQSIHLPGLPPVVDTDMAFAINSLTKESLADLCGDMFDDASIEAAQSRLQQLQDHIQVLNDNGCVISPDDWGKPLATKLLTEATHHSEEGRHMSYWQRDYENMRAMF